MTMRLARLFRAANTQRLATYLIALWKLFQHPQTPKPAKWVAIFVLAYALSPIDLIPDFIPVLGPLDDVVVAVIVLRFVRRRLGIEALRARWGGSDTGFRLLQRMVGAG